MAARVRSYCDDDGCMLCRNAVRSHFASGSRANDCDRAPTTVTATLAEVNGLR